MIEIRLPGQLLLLTAAEISRLLAARPEIWEQVLRRGETCIRGRPAIKRTRKYVCEAESELTDKVLDRLARG